MMGGNQGSEDDSKVLVCTSWWEFPFAEVGKTGQIWGKMKNSALDILKLRGLLAGQVDA
jgi:hypothetical protein